MKILALLLCYIYADNIPTHYIDKLEYNVVHDENGLPTFSQFIYWRFQKSTNRYVVAQWSLDKVNWDESDEEHKKAWMKEYEELCDKHPRVYLWANKSMLYRGKFDPKPPINFPQKNYSTKNYEMILHVGGVYRKFITPHFYETHTQYDIEAKNREEFKEQERVPYFTSDVAQ